VLIIIFYVGYKGGKIYWLAIHSNRHHHHYLACCLLLCCGLPQTHMPPV
jgi:hypothetical protein